MTDSSAPALPQALPVAALYHPIDPASLPYQRSDQATAPDHPVGQDRAVEAVQFALAMEGSGYNLFCMGPEGSGKASLVRGYMDQAAQGRPQSNDWAYVHNFAEPTKPRALALPPGGGPDFAKAMDGLIEDLRHALPTAFDGDQYRSRRREIEETFKQRHDALLEAHSDSAKGQNIALMRTPMGLALAPYRDGEVLGPEDFAKLPEDEQATWKERMQALQDELSEALRQVPLWEKEKRDQVQALNREVADGVVSHLIDELLESCAACSPACDYLKQVHDDVLDTVSLFLPAEDNDSKTPMMLRGEADDDPYRRYRVNVLVSQAGTAGAPVVDEDHPTQPNLMGRIEHRQTLGALVTDFNLIRPGALHRANGGFLVIEARKLLTQPFAWEDLKRALRKHEIRIESPGSSWGMWSTQGVEPEPIPLDVKVVLLGEPQLFYLLAENDPDFDDLFKVVADFDTHMPRTPDKVRDLSLLLADMARKKDLPPFEAGAIARVIEYGGRLVEDAERLTTNMGELSDLLRESAFMARQAKADLVAAAHVHDAIEARHRRHARIPQAMQEEIERGTIHIATSGEAVGQINGLAVYEIGATLFGKPSRITVRARLGRGDITDIEREADLSGPLHSKGVMILTSFLSSRFAEDRPLPMQATIVFEQSYGTVDGDSASSTEIYALLSALADTPIRQSFAVTGSVDQFGRVQAIGGVNEKIEGFFDLCLARGLTGEQGVLIPKDNIRHLMLRQDVVQACQEGRFQVIPVETIDQGIELLTGVPAGTLQDDGEWSAGSLNRRIAVRLSAWSRKAREQEQGQDSRRGTLRGG
jgi:lon-related putative ATP-dependent protease